MPAQRDCTAAIKNAVSAGVIGDVEAKELIAGITTLAKARARQKSLNIDAATKEIAGELIGVEKTRAALDKRNRLLTRLKYNQFLDYVQRWPVWGDGIEAFLGGSEKTSVQGAGLSIDSQINGLRQTMLRSFFANLDERGVLRDFNKGRHGLDVFKEAAELSKGVAGKPGITNNSTAKAIAEAWHATREQLVARVNRAGAAIQRRPDYIIKQTHDSDEIRRLGREGYSQESRETSYQAYKALILDLVDHEATFKGADPDTWLRRFHGNIYSRVFGGNKADNHLDGSISIHGSGVKSLNEQRHMHFRDAASAHRYNELFGMKNYAEAITSTIDSLTRQIVLSENLGPNFGNTFNSALRGLLEEARVRDDSGRQADSIQKNAKIKGMFALLTGEANVSRNPTLSKWTNRIRNVSLASKSGGIVLSSFGDKAFIQSEMAYQGISQLDTAAMQFLALLPKGKKRARALRELDVALTSLSGDISHAWQSEGRSNGDITQRITNSVFDLNLSNLWTDAHKNSVANLMARHVGEHSHLQWASVPKELRRVLEHYEISAAEWPALKAAAWKDADSAHTFVTSDRFADLPDAVIDQILAGKQQSRTAVNRQRERDTLATKYAAYIADRVDTAIPTPNVRTRYYLTGGAAQQGTIGRAVMDLLSIFKSFPLAVVMRVAGRERHGRSADTFKEWVMRDHRGKTNLALTIAATGFLGYASMAVKDALKGRTPKRLIDEDGNINGKVWLAALQQGGGLGIYGDFLFSEYGRQYKSVLGAIAGPAIGQLDPLGELITKGRSAAMEGDADRASEVPADAFNLALQNTPFQNLFYVKPVLDYFIFWNLKEALSPGILRRAEHSIEKQNVQEHFITPSEVAPLSFPEKIEYLTE